MRQLIEAVSHGVPSALREVITLGRTLKKRTADVLAYFDRPGTSNGPTEAIIIWSLAWGVADVADGADRVRRRHVIWSMSLTRTGWICLSLLAFPRPGRCQRVRRGHVPDATVQVTPRFLARAPDNRQPEDPTHHQNRLRLHLPPRSHRPRHAQPRRAPCCPGRPNLTHTSVRRAQYFYSFPWACASSIAAKVAWRWSSVSLTASSTDLRR